MIVTAQKRRFMKKNSHNNEPAKIVCIAECNYQCSFKQFPIVGKVDLRDLQNTNWCEKENLHVNENQQT